MSRRAAKLVFIALVSLPDAGCTLDAIGSFAAGEGGSLEAVSGSAGVQQGGAAPACSSDADCASTGACAVPRCWFGRCVAEAAPRWTMCRDSAGACDLPERCDGNGIDCPVDAIQPAGHACRPSAGECDVAEACDGLDAQCPSDAVAASGSVCRVAAGPCDLEEACDGTSPVCPLDSFTDSSVVCRAATNACDAGESCGGSAECPPDSGAVALCTPSLPVTWNAFERNYKVTSVNVAGTGGPTAVVAPGAAVSLVVSVSWQRVGNASCPGCITQLYFAMNGGFTSCVVTSNASGTFTKTINFTAPMTPGSYVVNPEGSWEYNCLANVTTGSTFTSRTIATVVVL